MIRLDKLLICFILAYVVVFLFEIIQAIVQIKFFSMKPLDADIFNDVFVKNKIWRPIYTVVAFSILAYAYNSSLYQCNLLSCLICGLLWLFLIIVFDLLFRIVIKSPCSFDVDEFYNNNYLFVIIDYGLVLTSPFIGLLFLWIG